MRLYSCNCCVVYHCVEGVLMNVMEDNDWDFWEDEAKITCIPYSSRIDEDMLNTLKLIAEEKFNHEIAEILNLTPQYVELMQSIFCHAGWCEYGTSPRGCWIDHSKNKEELIDKYNYYFKRRWKL